MKQLINAIKKFDTEMELWKKLTPAERDYKRFAGTVPLQYNDSELELELSKKFDITCMELDNFLDNSSCSCHIHPPCPYCMEGGGTDEEERLGFKLIDLADILDLDPETGLVPTVPMIIEFE